MKGQAQLMSSVKHDWETPPELFNCLNDEFKFVLDACANDVNHKCDQYFTEKVDGLSQDWRHYNSIWINPPYGSDTVKWVSKAIAEHKLYGMTIVMLIASRTGTKTWHELIVPYAAQIRFLKGRVKFVGAESGATFDSAIIVFSTSHYSEKCVFVDYR